MKYALVENGMVKQIQPNIQDGFIEVENSIICGMVTSDNITFTVPPQSQESVDAQRISEIDGRLNAIDIESVRPLRAINNGTATADDTDKLTELDAEAEALRVERLTLV